MTTNVLERIWKNAELYPDHPALSSTDNSLNRTWLQLAHDISAASTALQKTLRPGAHVLVLSHSDAPAYIQILGCMAANVIPAILDANAPAPVVEQCRQLVGAAQTLQPTTTCLAPEDHTAPLIDLPALEEDTPGVVLFTSGTTGTPKAVTLPQRSFLAIPDIIADQQLDWITWKPGEVTYTPLPASHIGGLWWVLNGLARAAHTITGKDNSSPLEIIRTWKVATTCTVPALMSPLAQELATTEHLEHLRLVVYGGSRAIEKDVAAIEGKGVNTAQIYGLSETGCTALCLPTAPGSLSKIAAGNIGTPYPGVQVTLIADSSRTPATSHSSDHKGTIWIKSPANMLGYHSAPEATSNVLVDNWINTGDIGVAEADGSYRLVGRASELIICGGTNVSPNDVDALAEAIPELAEAASFPISDPQYGEVVGLAVVPAHAPSENTPEFSKRALQKRIATHFRNHAEPEARPVEILFVDHIPRTPSGKIQRAALTKIHAESTPHTHATNS